MNVDLTLRNCQIFYENQLLDAGLAIDKGKIIKISKDLPPSYKSVDLKGCIVLPGLTDPHEHLRDQGLWKKGTIAGGTKSAGQWGLTDVIDMPNNKPPTITVETVRERLKLARENSHINYHLNAGITDQNLDLIPKLAKENIVGFKLFMAESTGKLMVSQDQMYRAFKQVSLTGKPLSVHPEDAEIIKENSKKYKSVIGFIAHARARPPEAEITAVDYGIKLVEHIPDLKLHFCHLSTEKSVEAVRIAKKKGLNVSAETCPHYLFMTEEDLREMGPYAKMNPPLRTEKDQIALWEGIIDGTIDMEASDNAPHTIEEKKRGKEDIRNAPSGVPGYATIVPLTLNALNNGLLDEGLDALKRLVKLMYQNAANRFNLGSHDIRIGNVANLTVIDLKRKYTISGEDLYECGWSPYDGLTVTGVPVMTVVQGKPIYNEKFLPDMS